LYQGKGGEREGRVRKGKEEAGGEGERRGNGMEERV